MRRDGESGVSPEALAAWLPRQRWFGGKARRITGVSVEDAVPLPPGVLHVVGVTLDDGSAERYAVPLVAGGGDLVDALDEPGFCRALLDLVALARPATGPAGQVVGVPTSAFPPALSGALPTRRLGAEQSNTSVAFGNALVMKHFRRLPAGVNPEQEITRFLTERTTFTHTPRLAGHLEYRPYGGPAATLAVIQEFIRGGRDGWQWVLGELADLAHGSPGRRAAGGAVRERAAASLAALRRLGRRTAELHLALASAVDDSAFAPEPITPADLASWADAVRAQLDGARATLAGPGAAMGTALPDVPRSVLLGALGGLQGRVRLRHHGDFHLGQTLYCPDGADFLIIDFEGEPLRPLIERRRKHTPLRDVAGLLRSIDYAAASAALAPEWAEAWKAEATAEFVAGYREGAGRAPFLPATDVAFRQAMAVFELEKAAYEVVYEANNRPDWIPIPVAGLGRAVATLLSLFTNATRSGGRSPRRGAGRVPRPRGSRPHDR